MIEVTVSSRGFKLEVLAEKFSKRVLQRVVGRLADKAWAHAFYEAPWRTGNLAQSIIKNVNGNEASIEALASYAMYVVNGTAPHEIKPANASALAFEARSGEVVFTRLVRHPGTKPNPFMKRAADQTASEAVDVFAEIWREEIA